MISSIFHTIIYAPLYNGLVYLVGAIPNHDVGIAVILLTIAVRIIIYPLSRRAVKAQVDMKKVAPLIEDLKKKYPDKEEQSRQIFALYKEHDVHPFAGFLLVLVQFPILIGLYWVFSRGGLPAINASFLYPFVHVPTAINMEFLGIQNMAGHSVVLAILAGITQFLYTRLTLGSKKEHTIEAESSLSGDMAKSLDTQARYVLPAIIAVIGFTIVAAAPLYWLTSNSFMILQEYLAGRRFRDT